MGEGIWRSGFRLVTSAATSGTSLLGELVEEGVVAFMGRPDGEVVGPGDAALHGMPEEFGVSVFGEFVEADVAAVNGHGLRVGGEGNDARAIVEFDVADFDFFGDGATRTGQSANHARHFDFEVIFAVGDDGFGEVVDAGEMVSDTHVFEGARIIFGCKEVVATRKAEPLANVFESIGVSPADANGFFCKSEDLLFLLVEGVFGANPRDLVREEVFAKERIFVDLNSREYCAHGDR